VSETEAQIAAEWRSVQQLVNQHLLSLIGTRIHRSNRLAAQQRQVRVRILQDLKVRDHCLPSATAPVQPPRSPPKAWVLGLLQRCKV
jgi:hypothetical protein